MQVDLRTVSVTIGMPAYGSIPPQTGASLFLTALSCGNGGVRCDLVVEQSSIVTVGRDAVLDDFLRGDTQKLFWIDSDIVWEPGEFFRLLALSTVYDVVCATYPRKVEGPPEFNIDLDPQVQSNGHGLLPIKGAGLGFTVVDRAVCEKLAAKKPMVSDSLNGRQMREVFRIDTIDGKRRSEDMAFFADIRELGFGVWLDPTINLGHVGPREWTGKVMDGFERTDGEG